MNAVNTGSTSYKLGARSWVSVSFIALALICLIPADFEIYPSDPWLEFTRFFSGVANPSINNISFAFRLLVNTTSFALLGVSLSCVIGFFLSLHFHRRLVRAVCAFVRAVHEIFWALILLQIFGLSVITGVLAIAIPYSGVFAKVYSEIMEESGYRRRDQLFFHVDSVSKFLYSKVPDVWMHFRSYTRYRFECGLRSSAILGFIGLPTLGFTLESAFSQGNYSEVWALLLIFYLLISTLGLWMRKALLPMYLITAIVLLPEIKPVSFDNIARFFSHDIVPYPLRGAVELNASVFADLRNWFWSIFTEQALPGIWDTLVLTQISLVATALLALFLFPLVSKKFFKRPARSFWEILLVMLRSTPEYMLAYMLLQLWGPSMLPAVVAIAVHNGAIIGHLLGRHSGSLAFRADSSVSRVNRYLFEVVPRVYGQFLAFLFYRWEIIFRETAILGILGISTLGFYIDSAIQELRMDRAILLIIITALINIGIDVISRRLRSNLHLNLTPNV